MTHYVLDASVTCAWLFEEERTPPLNTLLALTAFTEAFVPALWRAEVLNTLLQASRRSRIQAGAIAERWAFLDELMIRQPDYDPPTDQLITLCQAHGLTVYDAYYLALAMHLQLPLATLDASLARAAREEGVALVGVS